MNNDCIHALHYCFETGLVLYFARQITPKEKVSRANTAAAAICLLLTAVLYREQSLIDNVIARMLYRGICYIVFLYQLKKGQWKSCIYYALILTALFTANTNIFQTPLLYPVSRCLIVISGILYIDILLAVLAEYAFCFLMFFLLQRFVNMSGIRTYYTERYCVLLFILFSELYVKNSLHVLRESGTPMVAEMSLYTIILNLVLVGLIILFENFLYSRRMRERALMQELFSRFQIEAYRQELESRQNTDRLYHDMKNHMLAIRKLLDNDPKRAAEYADSIVKSYMSMAPVVRTGNTMLDGLLSNKITVARSNNIAVSVVLDAGGIRYISDVDLCTIVTNAFDNAIEACLRVTEETQRYIDIKGGEKNGQFFFNMRNSYCGKIQNEHGTLLTAKTDKILHGFGLGNIRRSVEKYCGECAVSYTDTEFELSIMLPVKEPEHNSN